MAGETVITIIGNVVADPELKFTPSGAAVASFTVASTPRSFDKTSNEWRDGESLFMRCSVWREAAENAAETLTKGMRVVVTGRLTSRSWEDKESGQRRSVMELQVDEVGPSLRYASAKVTKSQRGQGGAQASSGGWQAQAPATAPARDPWSSGAAQPAQAGGWGAPGGTEPPF